MFITFDGPNGVGKSTLIDLLKKNLEELGYSCYVTKEPTNTELGKIVKHYDGKCDSYSLAKLVAADRSLHQHNVISTKLREFDIVVSDRYFASSLILQNMDGLTYDEIIIMNKGIILPNIFFLLIANEDNISERLSRRNNLTRFELEFSPSTELEATLRAKNHLDSMKLEVKLINTSLNMDMNISLMTDIIDFHMRSMNESSTNKYAYL